jgi:hypothetical protein
MIEVKEIDEYTFEISWDENDPKESILNNFTEQDFIDVLMNRIKELEQNATDRESKDIL